MLECPSCGSQIIWKDGLRYDKGRPIQRHICRSCGYRFSESEVKVNISGQIAERPNSMSDLANCVIGVRNLTPKKTLNDLAFSIGEDVSSHELTTVGKGLSSFPSYNSKRRVCAEENEAKNLVETAKQIELQLRDNHQIKETIKGKLIEFAWWLYKDAKEETTIENYAKEMQTLTKRGANILNPESVKETVAKQNWTTNRKRVVIHIYTTFLRFLGKTWEKPKYQCVRKIPFIPTEKTLDQLIVGVGHKTSIYCQLLKETGVRPIQVRKLEWKDIDYKRCRIVFNPAKHGNPLIKKVSKHLIGRIKTLPKSSNLVFGRYRDPNAMATSLRLQRIRLAKKLNNPDIARITCYTFRYWYGTTLYHQTKDLLKVQRELGHKKIENTLFYIQIAESLYDDKPENYYVATAKTSKEFDKLLAESWEYVTAIQFNNETLHKFRKPKW